MLLKQMLVYGEKGLPSVERYVDFGLRFFLVKPNTLFFPQYKLCVLLSESSYIGLCLVDPSSNPLISRCRW